MLPRMAHVDVSHLRYVLPNGRVLLDDVSFRVGEGAKAALVGANGTGKTTLLRILAGELTADVGAAVSSGGLGVMPQFIGSISDGRDVRDLLLSVAPAPVRDAAAALDAAELAMMHEDDERAELGYADALARWTDVGGYDAEARVGRVLHGRAGSALRARAVPRRGDAVGRRAEAPGARGAVAWPRRDAAPRRARQLPGRAWQAVARAGTS